MHNPLFSGESAASRLIAHRGYALQAPQNSLPAFRRAGQLGFWAIETDVHRTEDGLLVCCHNARVDTMFSGTGAIREQSWQTLQRLTIRPEKANGYPEPCRMPLFREYLQICREYGAFPFIETKTADIAQVVETAAEYFREEEIILSSSNLAHLEALRKITDKVFIHHIFSDETSAHRLAELGNAGLSYNYPDWTTFPPELANKTHSLGLKLCLRAGDTPQAIAGMTALGLDYIPTNRSVPEKKRNFSL